MLRSLRSRLLISHLLVSGLVLFFVIAGLLIFLANSRLLEQQTYARLEGAIELVAQRGPRAMQMLGPQRLERALANLQLRNARAIALDAEGKVLGDTRPDQPLPPREELVRATTVNSGSYGGLLNRWLYVSAPLGDGQVLMLATPRPNFIPALGQDLIMPLILRAGLVALVASLVLSLLVSRWVAGPIQRTAGAARAVAAGDYQQRLHPSGPDEAHSLATSFNEMLQQVQGSQSAMREFVANVSHELKTPLTSIQGYAQAIEDGTAQDATQAVGIIHEEAERLGRLVGELLDLAKLDAGQVALDLGSVDLAAIVTAVVERQRLKAENEDIDLIYSSDPLPTIVGDGDRLAQVFTNLVDNALKHSPAQGSVEIIGSVEGAWISVQVRDSGPGIPAEELPRIFERFYQMDKARAGSGSGLGLAISREIVQAHGGSLTAQSERGMGSRFVVQLPIVRPDDTTLAGSPA